MKPHTSILFSLFSALILIVIQFSGISCSKEELNTDPDFRLEFSNDTVLFDTVFTSIGSSTQSLIVRNTSNKKIVLSSVRLGRGSESPFRVNIDGEAAFEVKDLEIAANDSAYIFVKVTIDPNQQDNPLIESDSVIFRFNDLEQNVKLVAWGQDAWFHADDTLRGSSYFGASKPHVIFGNLVVDSLSTLNIAPGCKLYFHNNSSLVVRNSGTLKVNGILDNPVIFRGDRLEDDYEDIAGQWLGIFIESGSINNQFSYADIRNARIGIRIDSARVDDNPVATLNSCIIHNMVNYGIQSVHSNIRAMNSRITNCGGYAVAVENGGRCEFRHCTVSNYWSSSSKQFQALLLSNNQYQNGQAISSPLDYAYFGNCIVSGNSFDEIEFDELKGTSFNVIFDHCLVQTSLTASYPLVFQECIVNEEPVFIDPWIGQFELDTLSFAKDAGSLPVISSSLIDITYDLKGKSRLNDSGPDLGCYERIENQ
jgi:hypothetical protein